MYQFNLFLTGLFPGSYLPLFQSVLVISKPAVSWHPEHSFTITLGISFISLQYYISALLGFHAFFFSFMSLSSLTSFFDHSVASWERMYRRYIFWDLACWKLILFYPHNQYVLVVQWRAYLSAILTTDCIDKEIDVCDHFPSELWRHYSIVYKLPVLLLKSLPVPFFVTCFYSLVLWNVLVISFFPHS